MLSQLKRQFYQQVFPSQPNEWEVDEGLEPLLELDGRQQNAVLSFVHVVWPVSNSLCFSYIHYGAANISSLGVRNLEEWVRQLLDHYEREGLGGARSFMSDVENNFFKRIAGDAGTDLIKIRGRLLPFIRGVSSIQFDISVAEKAWTDSSIIYLPGNINYFLRPADNQSYYTFLACCQWGYLSLGTLSSRASSITPIEEATHSDDGAGGNKVEAFFQTFTNPSLASGIFHFIEFARVFRMLNVELPGLMRRVNPLLLQLLTGMRGTAKNVFWTHMYNLVSEIDINESKPDTDLANDKNTIQHSLEAVKELYVRFSESAGPGDWEQFQHITGVLQFKKVREQVERRRAEEKKMLIQQIALFLQQRWAGPDPPEEHDDYEVAAEKTDGSRVVISLSEEKKTKKRKVSHKLQVNTEEFALPPELSDLIHSITQDIGPVPEGYLQAAAGIAGNARQAGKGGGTGGGGASENPGEATYYDEWDYRRQGYRKNWCALIEKEIAPVRSQFVVRTLNRHRGKIIKLRRQFEMLRTRHRFNRRRRHGDDIDFDALVEAVGDRIAGLAPTDRLFIRLLRDERDIAVMFLVDMSNSTEGWVGKAIKESLVLLCDVLEVVGDKYGIYGFSGMRRSRCELFKIKEMDERYDEHVQQRICAISPREYTRMAPPIRHLTNELMKTEARVKLLITISDGKPEDYDDYRGEYAIEDTRQALIEARGKGVIPFCITVDREAHSYLSHMFGKGNYIYVDGVDKLPARMPEIYRLLTH